MPRKPNLFASVFNQTEMINPPGVLTELLLSTDASWEGTPYPEYPTGTPLISVLKISIPPYTTLAWHYHPILVMGYLLDGTLTIEKQNTNEQKTFVCGELIPEVVDTVHRGITGARRVELLVFYIGGRDIPLSIISEIP